jgi:hypothetical protein
MNKRKTEEAKAMEAQQVAEAVRLRTRAERDGFQFALVGGELQIRAPRGQLTQELVESVEAHSEALRLLLLDEAKQRSERCATLAREVLQGTEKIASANGDDIATAAACAQVREALGSLLALVERNPESGEREPWCWRCGAPAKVPVDVAGQIALHITAAGWQGWGAEQFRVKMADNLRDGDRILSIRHGAVVIRRADGTTVEVSRYDG